MLDITKLYHRICYLTNLITYANIKKIKYENNSYIDKLHFEAKRQNLTFIRAIRSNNIISTETKRTN